MFQSTGKKESLFNAELLMSSNNDSEEDEGSCDGDSNENKSSNKNNDRNIDSDSSDGDENDDAFNTAKSNASDASNSESIDSKDSLPISPKKSTFFTGGNNEKVMNLLGKKIKDVKGAGSKGQMSEIFNDKLKPVLRRLLTVRTTASGTTQSMWSLYVQANTMTTIANMMKRIA